MPNTTVLTSLRESIQQSDTDFSVEVLASSIIDKNIFKNELISFAIGTSKRAYRKDLSEFKAIENKENLLFIHVTREGIYDGLPEFIFHYPITSYSSTNPVGIIEKMKKFREEEKQARLFFLPFEQEFFSTKVTLQQLLKEFESPFLNQSKQQIFSSCWPIFNRLDKISGYIFLCILPFIHTISNNLKKCSECLSAIINVPMHVSVCTLNSETTANTPSLGDGLLGIDTIVGSSVLHGESDICVEVGPMPKSTAKEFQYKGAKQGIIEDLCNFLFSANYFISIKYLCERSEEPIALGEETMLGIDTYM